MTRTFKGGISVAGFKCAVSLSENEKYLPSSVTLALDAGASVLVANGAAVKAGEPIAECADHTPVLASISGTVDIRANADGGAVAVIVSDRKCDFEPAFAPFDMPITELERAAIIERIRAAAIRSTRKGDAPLHIKLARARAKEVGTLIINCTECEPYVTSRRCVISEHPDEIVAGAKILLYSIGARRCIFVTEARDRLSRGLLSDVIAENSDEELIRMEKVRSRYPQGEEKQLIYSLFKRELRAERTPESAGYSVLDAELCLYVYRACAEGIPMLERTLTVTGDCVAQPKNITVPLGTRAADITKHCIRLKKPAQYTIAGGAMTGEPAVAVDSAASALTLISRSAARKRTLRTPHCIRCGRCIESCPMHLSPYLAARAVTDDAAPKPELRAELCTGCGVCTYVCPGELPLARYMQTLKARAGGDTPMDKQKSDA